MRGKVQAVSVAIVSAFSLASGHGQSAVIKPTVTVSISAAGTAKLGRPIMLHIVLRNDGPSPGTVPEQRHSGEEGEFNYQVFVSPTDGEPLPDTEYGRKIRTHSLVCGYAPSIIYRLEPGNQISEDLDLTKLVKMDLLGTYIVQVERDSPAPLNVRSNSVRIRIEP